MRIGLPKALLYHRYGALWETFFEKLGCETVPGGDTNGATVAKGIAASVDECCLPLKVFLGQVAGLMGRADYVLVPRFERLAKDEEYCVRFTGLPDIVHATFPEARLLTYNHQGQKPANELQGFLNLGTALGASRPRALAAYRQARRAQAADNSLLIEEQTQALAREGIKVLIAAQPYIIHDAHMGGPLLRMLGEQGALPIFADRCDRAACAALAGELSHDLYWRMNKELIGAIPLLRGQVDGAILVTAFPCGTDSLVNELVLRRVKGLPVTHIVLDEQEGEAGLQTRVECFVDILRDRRRSSVG